MSFEVSADSYAAFMGRFAEPLAIRFSDWAGVTGMRALDVGCGPGTLATVLAGRFESVCAVEPSMPFARAARDRLAGGFVCRAEAEHLPFGSGAFDATLAQLVVHFMHDPVAGLREMGRVTRRGGTVAACVWDFAGGRSPVSLFWRAARELDPAARDESRQAGAGEGHLADILGRAGLGRARTTALTVTASYQSFEEWWQTYTLGVGPSGAYAASLGDDQRRALRERCRDLLTAEPGQPIEVTAVAWAAAATRAL